MSQPTAPRFRNAQGVRYLKALFFEETLADKSNVVYTLKDQDHEGYPSLYRLYMEANDPTEWRFANQHLDGWEHWQMLTECTWFKPYIARWRKELQLRLSSEALTRIIAESKSSSRNAFTANRFLLEGGWKATEQGKAGRPSKQAIREEAARIASSESQIASDFERIVRPN